MPTSQEERAGEGKEMEGGRSWKRTDGLKYDKRD